MTHIRVDMHPLAGVPDLDSAPAIITINALQAMYGEDVFKPLALHTFWVPK